MNDVVDRITVYCEKAEGTLNVTLDDMRWMASRIAAMEALLRDVDVESMLWWDRYDALMPPEDTDE